MRAKTIFLPYQSGVILECGGLTPLSYFAFFFRLPSRFQRKKERKRRQIAALQSVEMETRTSPSFLCQSNALGLIPLRLTLRLRETASGANGRLA